MFRWIVLIACLLAAAVGLAVGILNPEVVNLSLPGIDLGLPLGSLLIIFFAAGLACGFLLFLILFHLPSRFGREVPAKPTTSSRTPDRHA